MAIAATTHVVGKFGMHRGQYEKIGSTAENIAELATTNVLIVSVNEPSNEKENSNIKTRDIKSAYEKVSWTDEARKRLENIPSFARPMAILAIERYAKEKGHRIITPEIMKKARDSAKT
jgi:hypothetical protein